MTTSELPPRKLANSCSPVGVARDGSHFSSEHLASAQFEKDIERNEQFLATALGTEPVTNFAYPFGRVSVAAKRIAAKRFVSARGVRSGVNKPTQSICGAPDAAT
jgi:hypothetical protein